MLPKFTLSITAVFCIPTMLAQSTGAYPYPPAQKKEQPRTGRYPSFQKPEESLTPPAAIRVCANSADWLKCGTWVWENGHYAAWREWGAHASVVIQSFTRESVALRRTDIGGFWQEYRGTISSDGNSILDGKSAASDNTSGTFRAYWGTAMLQHPELTPDQWGGETTSDAECNGKFAGNGGEAALHASHALEAKNVQLATCWLKVGVEKGNSDAMGMLAVLLYRGLAGPVSYPDVLSLAEKAAVQDNYVAARVLSNMYANGEGVAKDAAAARTWNEKADSYKTEATLQDQLIQRVRQNNIQQNQARGVQNAGAILMFGLLLGAMADGTGSSDSSSHESFDHQMSRAYRNMCLGGDSHACAQ